MSRLAVRGFNLACFALCAGLLGYAYYSQFHADLDPCPLCILQRLGILAVGLLFLAAGLHNPGRIGGRIYAVLIAFAATVGGAVSARHVWIQNLPPDRIPDCGPSLDYMFEVFPFSQALEMVLTGSGECAEVAWVFLGLSMPGWVLICFVALGAGGLLCNWNTGRRAAT